ncbi:hypothetical protein WICPIJ_004032 [Wickerhamomyces pijperi]|uniref:Uncharacterized protein n=1 Tax=Wickerhamomyces pijperi TaxID=599730 RepID=A0A9P8Q8Q3_WICPI|nr:hypothetical protein WICPIJ_004032 [Wickerhamomyces pijperi]
MSTTLQEPTPELSPSPPPSSLPTSRELHKIKCLRPIIAKCVTYLNIGVDETLNTRISEQKVEIINDAQLDFSKVEDILKISKIEDVLSEDSIKKNSPLICIQIAASSLKTLEQTTEVIYDKMSAAKPLEFTWNPNI